MSTLYRKAGLICTAVATAAVLSAMPLSIQRSATSGIVVSVPQAQAYYGHYRRAARREYRYVRPAYGYNYPSYSSGYNYPSYSSGYSYPSYGYGSSYGGYASYSYYRPWGLRRWW
jgi:hypothetical protein